MTTWAYSLTIPGMVNVRLLIVGALVSLSFGCATGAPSGGRHSSLAAGYRSFSRASAPRGIPGAGSGSGEDVRLVSATRPSANARARAVALARDLVGKKRVEIDGKRYRDDCTGLITGVFDNVGVDLMDELKRGDNAVTAVYRYAQRHGRVYGGSRPVPGDLVFFRETYDQNRDGRDNDGLTHIGLVEDVARDGTVTVIHRVARGVVRYRMNLANPDLRRDPRTGRVLNDFLRHAGPGRRELLTGQLFAAYATVLPVADGATMAQR